jgi:hypothetical protein
MSYCVYRALDLSNGMSYVGFTGNYAERHHHHLYYSKRNPTTYFRRALGQRAFAWSILHESDDKEHCLHVMEPYFIRILNTKFPNGYNFSDGGDGGSRIVTLEQRAAMSKANYESGRNWVSLGATEAARLVNTGKKQTQEHREKRLVQQRVPITLYGVTYPSQNEAAKALGVCPASITMLKRKLQL